MQLDIDDVFFVLKIFCFSFPRFLSSREEEEKNQSAIEIYLFPSKTAINFFTRFFIYV